MPDEKDLVKAGVKGAVEGIAEGLGFRDLVQQFLGPFASEVGTGLGYVGTVLRVKLGVQMMQRAKEMLTKAGIQPAIVAPKLFLPLLENASLEEEQRLQECWAALLANAARPDIHIKLTPSYIEILKQLSPPEVRFLQSLSRYVLKRFPRWTTEGEPKKKHRDRSHNPEQIAVEGSVLVKYWFKQTSVLNVERIRGLAQNKSEGQATFELTSNVMDLAAEIRVATQNLIRLGLIAYYKARDPLFPDSPDTNTQKSSQSPEQQVQQYCVTSLGMAFVTACQKPTTDSGWTIPGLF
jgi:Abortive infection alpha